MKIHVLLRWVSLTLPIFIILISQSQSHLTQTQPILDDLTIGSFVNKTLQWKSRLIKFQGNKLKLSASTALAGVFCFIAASISSAGGIGEGGLFIPILTIVAGLDLKTASSFSAFMVTGGSIANVMYNLRTKSAKFGGKNLIDYDIVLLSEPCMLLGVSVGVVCNLVLPEWLITILFAIFLVFSTFKTCRNGVGFWKMESDQHQETRNGCERLEIGVIKNGTCGESGEIKSLEEPLVGTEGKEKSRFPWKKLLVLIMVWFSFFIINLLRGNRYGQGIIPMKPCGVGYWTVSLFQIPLALAFTAWILSRKEAIECQGPNKQKNQFFPLFFKGVNTLIFPLMALLAGGLGGVFGIGGGMLISPLLLQVGVAPEVTAATCSFMVFFSSTMSAFQYLLSGMEHTTTALIFSVTCFVASLLGLVVAQKAIKELGRASLIVFSVGIVMALSSIMMTSLGALDVWEDYSSGSYMGFKLPC
ncbi:sulfite exporter TauE/SafE family protein 5-like [Durio zibethinus]|uniref:Sulfite exporter TauE/SafE family protein 5-like n=1 Tax=Durio zibethinus TaxID=66656 RepID=A0A6P5X9L3_DURZI|nr:sulfite exporter TauE/SafE family protein 5-like [Durio zibethinus]